MQLAWFEVQGYKNLQGLRLDDLGRFNVLHGDNNVGKSNILESIGLLFVALRALRDEGRGGPGIAESFARRTPAPAAGEDTWRTAYRSGDYLAGRGFAVDDIFHATRQGPITLSARVTFDVANVDGGEAPPSSEAVELAVRIERQTDDAQITLLRLVRPDGEDLAAAAGAEAKAAALRLLDRLSPRSAGRHEDPRFTLLRADRTVLADPPVETTTLGARDPLPQALGMTLYEAERARGPARERFDRFLAALERARDLVGAGRWRMDLDPATTRADLVLERSGEGLIPLRLMGTGVQQIAAVAGALAMSGAAVVAIEEPELNLRWKTQHLLRDAMRALVGLPGGPAQLFVTSHAAAFEFEPEFYAITAGPNGPTVQRRPKKDAPKLLDPEVDRPPEGARAPLSYVTGEGLVRVPDHAREALGVRDGGGVVFVRGKDGYVKMLTSEQFIDLFEEER